MPDKGKPYALRLLPFDTVGDWAEKHNMSINSAINFMVVEYMKQEETRLVVLETELKELRDKIVKVCMAYQKL